MTLESVAPHLFNNVAFWQVLGSSGDCVPDALGRLYSLLCASRAINAELLENKKIKKRTGNVFDVLFKEPESIIFRAVHTMFAYRDERSYEMSLSKYAAARRFSMPLKEIAIIYIKAMADETSESHHAASSYGRITLLTLIPAVLARKGGFHRVKLAAANRAKARAKARKEFIPVAMKEVEEWFLPLLVKARPFIASNDKNKKKGALFTLVKNYELLNTETQCLLCTCENKKGILERRFIASWLRDAKKYARRLHRALSFVMKKQSS